ncbi:ABC transporter permease subunit [Ahrensia marina]|uniref:ABC transporter permease n=1 Tax=Ahrensia marina TaxID=1514904 RepID=UPI0035CEF4AA
MDFSLFAFGATGWGDELATGFLITLAMALTSYAVGTVLGLGLSLVEGRDGRVLPSLASGFGVLFRSVPELLILFLVFYGATLALSGLFGLVGVEATLRVGPFAAGVIALSMVHGAYAAEVFKGAFVAVPPGYLEAAKALGMSPRLAFFKIKLPLALRYAFPGLSNLWMVMIKNTPLVSAIGVSDLIRQASRAGENTREYLAFFLAALAVYLILSGVSLIAQERGQAGLFRHIGGQRV